MQNATLFRRSVLPRDVCTLSNFDGKLADLGFAVDERDLKNLIAYSMDSLQPTVTPGSITTPVQFLQTILPGFVQIATAPRQIDKFTGIQITGNWSDEQILQQVVELTGKARPYQDYTNVPYASWNSTWNIRTVVRFEQGMRITRLQEQRAAAIRINDAASRRDACRLALDIERNDVGFYGFNAGANNTFGFLNAPELSPYSIVPPGAAGSTTWASKSYLEIQKDLLTAAQELRTISKGLIDPANDNITIAVANNTVQYLAKSTDYGYTPNKFLAENFRNARVVSAPQLDDAHADQNVFYMYAETVPDTGTDGGAVWIQPVPTVFQMMGIKNEEKGYSEDYSMATAGVMCKRPYAVVRFYGI
jgi:hypothetical protein